MRKPHNVGGAIREASEVWIWVWLNDDAGVYIKISKAQAREYVNAAKEDGLENVLAYEKGGELFLGDDEETETDAAAEEADEEEEEEDLGEEEEEEEDADEEEEEDGQEEAPVAEPAAGAKKRK